jgi:translation initiation factor 1A
MHKRQWVNISDIVLISLRDFQDEKAEVIHRYTAEESRELLKIGELPEKCYVSQSVDEDEEQDDCGFVFEDI